MFKSLSNKKSRKPVSAIFEKERETMERKKCKNCLQSVKIDYLRCPHCGRDDFQFDSN